MEDDVDRARRARGGSPYLNTAQAAHFLHISERSLRRLRSQGEGPVFRLHIRTIVYHVDDLRAWSRARSAEPRS